MKEATGELNMTLVTILAVAAILAFVTMFVPTILDSIQSKWGNDNAICEEFDSDGKCVRGGK